MTIQGGFVLRPRCIMNSKIASAPPHVRELFDLIVRLANHEPAKYRGWEIQKGQLFRPYSDLREKLHWHEGWEKKMYTPDQIKKGMKYLRDNGMVTTKRAPGGVLITICKYSYYQNIDNYRSTKERSKDDTNKSTFEEPSMHDQSTINNNNDISNNNYQNTNNSKKKYLSDLDDLDKLDEQEDIAYELWKIITQNFEELKINLESLKKATCENWAYPINQLLTIHNKTKAEIKEVLEFFPTVNFWKNTLKHPKQLIKKNENGILFFDSILIQKREADAQTSLPNIEELQKSLELCFPKLTKYFVEKFNEYAIMCKESGMKILKSKTLDLEINKLAYLSNYEIVAAVNILSKAISKKKEISNRNNSNYYPND